MSQLVPHLYRANELRNGERGSKATRQSREFCFSYRPRIASVAIIDRFRVRAQPPSLRNFNNSNGGPCAPSAGLSSSAIGRYNLRPIKIKRFLASYKMYPLVSAVPLGEMSAPTPAINRGFSYQFVSITSIGSPAGMCAGGRDIAGVLRRPRDSKIPSISPTSN